MYQRAVRINVPKSESLDVEFNSVSYEVTPFRKSKKQILKGVTGCFKSGELTAIMGPSGAGKSSLLNILTGFQKKGVTGDIQFQSKQGSHNWKHYKKESCYIQQDDLLHPLFTIQEIMMMACDLKLGSNFNKKMKELVIEDVLEILDLNKTKETRCGNLSGGQRKRLSIALELIDNPPVMFLDEPTTGLDSSASVQCVAMLQNLAKGGRTIVCTIHQPSATIYELFDHVYLLAEGKCMFQGHAKNTVDYLQKLGLNCPVYHNPADYIIEVVSKEYGDFNERLTIAASDCHWRADNVNKNILYHSDSVMKFSDEGKITVLIKSPTEFTRFCILFKRCFIQLFRDWTVTYLKLILHIFLAVLLGLVYSDFGWDGSKSIYNVCFMLVNLVYICYTSMMPAVMKLPSELPVVRKERFNNWYKLRTFYAAFLLSNLPIQLALVIIYTSIAYFLSSQSPDINRYAMVILVICLVSTIAESFGLILGTVLNPVNGTFLGCLITCTMLEFAGFLVLFDHMPKFMYYLTYTSYLRYGLEALVHAIYGFDRPNLPCPMAKEISFCIYRIPKTILKELAMVENHYWRNVMILCLHVIFLRILGYYILKRKVSSL